MLQIFFEWLLIGGLLATALAVSRALMRRAARRRQQEQLVAAALRCVRPLDLSER